MAKPGHSAPQGWVGGCGKSMARGFPGIIESPTKAERVRAGLLTPGEARIVEHLTTPIGEHFEAFAVGLEASGATANHIRETRRILGRVLSGCDFHTLAEIRSEMLATGEQN